jgi:hypothetical protein
VPHAQQVDWNKWVDEDDDDAGSAKDDFDLGNLQNFTNFDVGAAADGQGGAYADSDSDDDLPELEEK